MRAHASKSLSEISTGCIVFVGRNKHDAVFVGRKPKSHSLMGEYVWPGACRLNPLHLASLLRACNSI